MIRNVAAQAQGAYGTSSVPTREKSPVEGMLGKSVDSKFRERILKDLAKLPPGAVSKLQEDGWKVELVDYSDKANGCKDGGKCRTEAKIVELDRAAYEDDKDGKILLHEMAHALDFKGCEAPGLLRKLMGVQGKAIMGTDKNAAFGAVYQKFQAQHMVSVAQQALKIRQERDPQANQVNFSTPFQGDLNAAVVQGKLVVMADTNQSANQAKSLGINTAVGPMPEKLEINGVQVKNSLTEQHYAVTVVDQKDAAKLSTAWTGCDSYVASSHLPSELYAEGVAAYLGSPESRRELQQQSPEVHAFVEQAMNEFLIAGPR